MRGLFVTKEGNRFTPGFVALRIAAFVRPIDEYAVVSVSGYAVVVLTAKSQSVKAMGKADFQCSKDAVLDILATLIGSSPGEIARAGESAAAGPRSCASPGARWRSADAICSR